MGSVLFSKILGYFKTWSNVLCFGAIFISILSLTAPLTAQVPKIHSWERLVPSLRLPDRVIPQKANNNLDLVLYQGRYYLAFRSAPNHFASSKTQIYIMSSPDLENWEYEREVFLAADMREPRFVEYHDTLFFYFFEGGTHPLKFEPRRLHASYKTASGKWSDLRRVSGLDGWVPWRVRLRDDTLYLSAYFGQELYKPNQQSELRLFSSTDGLNWQPIDENPQVSGTSAEEGEFIFDDEGNLWGTVRREDLGGIVVYADKDSLHRWKKRYTGLKYDSALLFKHNNEIYLIARRNLDGDGTMNKAPAGWPYGWQMQYNLLRYSFNRKRTALFKLDKKALEMVHLADLPSTGDNSFAGIAPVEKDRYVIMNYSNDINGPKLNWIRGQLRPTFIYKAILEF